MPDGTKCPLYDNMLEWRGNVKEVLRNQEETLKELNQSYREYQSKTDSKMSDMELNAKDFATKDDMLTIKNNLETQIRDVKNSIPTLGGIIWKLIGGVALLLGIYEATQRIFGL